MTATESEVRIRAWCDPGVLAVVAENADSLQEELTRAVQQVRGAAAAGDRRGILITRRSRSLFTVQASTAVAYGTTVERDAWHRPVRMSSGTQGDDERL